MNLALIPLLPGVGPTELIIVLVIILLLFGAKRIPELAKGLGTGVREFKAGTKGGGEVDGSSKKKDEELSVGGADDADDAHVREDAEREERAAAERAEQQR